eukprot:CAMPEP_0205861790 /NCGR_PEP_ID=MMETSP1083-20121108/5960_1 /ASSEMBLY_ACC=CAM_ASM_000430 /TAXON_ID=97485 /ORGANISM="Prymnesium parvum, Strain Texoma1" /LENGTH=321 /DNA_ID=CAMNT_0053223523 /DNA_START=83 /DNA_END=1048 /DNA_ORIENTATION=-
MSLFCQSLVLLLLHLVASAAAMLRVLLPGRPIRAAALASAATPEVRVPDYAAFDWMKHWYPVMWSRDAPLDKPTRLTLFDTDYAVVLRSDGSPPLALLDVCPHRLAALSEGRLTEQGFLQCAYHGWAFDGEGSCKAIPQRPTGGARPSSACAQAVNAVESQGIVWLNPARVARQASPQCRESRRWTTRSTGGRRRCAHGFEPHPSRLFSAQHPCMLRPSSSAFLSECVITARCATCRSTTPFWCRTSSTRTMASSHIRSLTCRLTAVHSVPDVAQVAAWSAQAPSFDLYSATAAEPLNVRALVGLLHDDISSPVRTARRNF